MKNKYILCEIHVYIVATTDLFPFANLYPRQEIRSLPDQSTGGAH